MSSLTGYNYQKLYLIQNMIVDCMIYNDNLISRLDINRGAAPNYQLGRTNYLFSFLK